MKRGRGERGEVKGGGIERITGLRGPDCLFLCSF